MKPRPPEAGPHGRGHVGHLTRPRHNPRPPGIAAHPQVWNGTADPEAAMPSRDLNRQHTHPVLPSLASDPPFDEGWLGDPPLSISRSQPEVVYSQPRNVSHQRTS
jgi:hypothetical protein